MGKTSGYCYCARCIFDNHIQVSSVQHFVCTKSSILQVFLGSRCQLMYIHGCREWFGKAVAAFLFWVVMTMFQARMEKIRENCDEIVVCTATDQSTMESIVAAQQGLQNVHEIVKTVNIAVLKFWSIFISKTRKVYSHFLSKYFNMFLEKDLTIRFS